MDLELRGKSVLVAGSSRGIGLGIAAAFLAEGAGVAITGRDAAGLKSTEETLRAAHPGATLLAIAGDLTDEHHCAEAIAAIVKEWGTLDILVANIGSGTGRPGWQFDAKDWAALYEINLFGSVRLIGHALPHMVAAKSGSIVIISSITGVEATHAPLAYSSAKAALLNYTKNLSHQVGSEGVRVNAVAPGNILFPGGSWEKRIAKDPAGTEAFIKEEVPMRRFGTPSEIADAVLFLSSPRASFITGACLVADGGQTRSL
jgi:3-oxoacyl-[acyl-carrier protein] reductase